VEPNFECRTFASGNTGCTHCGGVDERCCNDGPVACLDPDARCINNVDGFFRCLKCGRAGSPCCPSGAACTAEGTQCIAGFCQPPCTAGLACCPGNVCNDQSCCVTQETSTTGRCIAAGELCAGFSGTQICESGTSCRSPGSSDSCGYTNGPCCVGNTGVRWCASRGSECRGSQCLACGRLGEYCCGPDADPSGCAAGLTCDTASGRCM
jgi:hypothetical protein